MIPDEAVEAAADAIIDRAYGQELPEAPEDLARVALEAALPYLASAAKQPQRNTPTDWPDIPKASAPLKEVEEGQ